MNLLKTTYSQSTNNFYFNQRARNRVLTEVQLPIIIKITMILFVFSLYFNNFIVNIGVMRLNATLISGTLLAVVFFANYYNKIKIFDPHLNIFIILFLFLIILDLFRIFNSFGLWPGIHRMNLWVNLQLLIMLIMISNILRNSKFNKLLFTVFIISIILAAITTVFDVSLFSRVWSDRVGIQGTNLNSFALLCSTALCVLLSIVFHKNNYLSRQSLFYLVICFILLLAIFKTASRGGFVTFVAGLTIIILLNFGFKRLPIFIVMLPILFYGLYNLYLNSGYLAYRVNQTVESKTNIRLELIDVGLDLLMESPLTGVGGTYVYVLGNSTGTDRRGAHNTYLEILLKCGIIGLLLFLAGISKLIFGLLRYRYYLWGKILLVTLLVLLIGGLTANNFTSKYYWLIFVFCAKVDYFVMNEVNNVQA